MSTSNQIIDLLGPDAQKLLNYKAKGFAAEALHLPGRILWIESWRRRIGRHKCYGISRPC